MSDDKDFEYENRLEHEILWPPEPTCTGCGGPEEHTQIPCDNCGQLFCKPHRILDEQANQFCSKNCMEAYTQKES